MKFKVKGVPYSKNKTRGDTEAPQKWTDSIIKQTKGLTPISNPCTVEIEFVLPEDKYPPDYPYGPDIDNLLKRAFDALNETVFSRITGKDSAVIEIHAKKRKAQEKEEPGAKFIIKELRQL